MTKKTLKKGLASLTLAALALGSMSGCASQTTINSTPAGAKLMIDGAPVGSTPYQYSEASVWLWTKHQVQLKKSGYQMTGGMLSASISPTHLIAGIFCCFPLILVGQYDPQYNFFLQRKGVGGKTVKEVWQANTTSKKKEVISINFSE